MVSKASEDLPEPESPVKTTSLSRGISRSMFLRLCSRAPRMVIAREAEPAVFWRFALITSSISAIPGAWSAPRSGAHLPGGPEIERQWVSLERRKNARTFPVSRASHQRFVGWWRQQAAAPPAKRKQGAQQKGRREAGLFSN